MTPSEAALPAHTDYGRFKRICRAALRKMGVSDVKFKVSSLTGGLLVIVDTDAARHVGVNVLVLFEYIIGLGDEYGVPVVAIPAAAIRLSKAGID